MHIIEGIFYTNLDIDISAFIVEIKQDKIIDKYTIFVIFNDEHGLVYDRYWKHHDCSVLRLENDKFPEFSNNQYSNSYLIRYEKYFKIWSLLDKYIKFTRIRMSIYCKLSNDLEFAVSIYLLNNKSLGLNHKSWGFKYKYYTIEEFITEIQENYPEFYKYYYSQIKPAITN